MYAAPLHHRTRPEGTSSAHCHKHSLLTYLLRKKGTAQNVSSVVKKNLKKRQQRRRNAQQGKPTVHDRNFRFAYCEDENDTQIGFLAVIQLQGALDFFTECISD